MRTPIDLVVAKYIHEMEAERARDELKIYDKQIVDLAIVVKDKDGKITIEDRDDLEGRDGRNMGALIGGLVGLAFGPGGLLGAALGIGLGMASGVVTGKIVADNVDTGIKDETLRKLTHDLEPTSSAILLVLDESIGDDVIEILEAHKADIKRYDLNLKFDEKAKHSSDEKKKA